MYLIAKHSHLTLVLLSVSFLIIRVIAASVNAQWLQQKWAKIAPHIIDTLLLISVIVLMALLQQYPIVNGWLTAKLIALIAYIIFAARAMKANKNAATRFTFLFIALCCIAYMATVAITKNPLPF